MTIESYNRFLKIFFIVFIPITLLEQFGKYMEFIKSPAFWFFILYGNSILALTLLYFGIYARRSGIKNDPKSDGPIVYIILGCLLVLLAFGRPIFAVYFTRDIQPIHRSAENREMEKKAALDATVWSSNRLSFAKYYYLDTGETIEYLDERNNKTTYLPDKETKEHYEKTEQMYKGMNRINRFIRSNGLAHGSILLLSIPAFLLLIRNKKRNFQGSIH